MTTLHIIILFQILQNIYSPSIGSSKIKKLLTNNKLPFIDSTNKISSTMNVFNYISLLGMLELDTRIPKSTLVKVFSEMTQNSTNSTSLAMLVYMFRKGLCYEQKKYFLGFSQFFRCELYIQLTSIKIISDIYYINVLLTGKPIFVKLIFLIN